MGLKVYAAKWDVRKGGEGFELFTREALAIDAVLSYVNETDLLEQADMSGEEARAELEETGRLEFESRECWYSVEECEVKGPEDVGPSQVAAQEAMVQQA